MRETLSPGLWILRVDCTVITSTEDPGKESFQKGGKLARQENLVLCRRRHPLLPLKQGMNANVSSANRQGTPQMFVFSGCVPPYFLKMFFSHEIKHLFAFLIDTHAIHVAEGSYEILQFFLGL